MDTKVCFKCGKEKKLSEFYVHKKMGDGHLGKCKECAKNDVREKYIENIQDESYMEKERIRGREKYKRLNYVERTQYKKSYSSANRTVNSYLRSRGINLLGKEVHHWSYQEPYNVFILSKRAHKLVHKNIEYNELLKCFVAYGETILDTKSKHFEYIKKVFNDNNVNYEIDSYPIDYINDIEGFGSPAKLKTK